MSALYEAIRTYLVEEETHPPFDAPDAWERTLADIGYGYFSEFDIADALEEHADELEVLASHRPQRLGRTHNRNLNGEGRR